MSLAALAPFPMSISASIFHGDSGIHEAGVFDPVVVHSWLNGRWWFEFLSKDVAEKAIDGEVMKHVFAPFLVIGL